VDKDLFPIIGILAGGNPNGYREYGGKIHQIFEGHKVEKIHFPRSNICLHGHIKGLTGISNPIILGKGLELNDVL